MILICTVILMIEVQGYIGIARYPIRYRTDISVTNVISANTDISVSVSVVVYQ